MNKQSLSGPTGLSDPNCGCNNPSSPSSNDYLLVKATASEASTCGPTSGNAGTAACPKQEPTYDVSMSDFLLPDINGNTSMEVCNASIYTLSMWLHFSFPNASLQITGVTGNILTLVNKCPNGQPIDSNPIIGTVISKGATFVVGPKPQCNTDAEDQERINSAFAVATELCIPNMVTSPATATIRPIGKVESDSADIGVKKCIKAIYGILFKAGTPVLTNLILKESSDLNYRRLVKHKTTNEVVHLKNYSETPNITAQSYALLVNKNTEKLVPTYFFNPVRYVAINTNSSTTNFSDWDLMPSSNEYEKDVPLNDQLEDLFNDRDHVYAIINIDLGMHVSAAGTHTIRVILNGVDVGRVTGICGDSVGSVNSISVPVKILKSGGYNLNVKLSATNTGTKNYYLRVVLNGCHY